jgi:two-component system, NarL family, invasion response regulator UvrY
LSIKVLIVDDHALVRMGIRHLLESHADMEIIAEAESGEKALTMVKLYKPDVVLLDLQLPGIDGWEVTRRLKKSHPNAKIIAITALNSEPLPTRILQLGAMGYLTKESSAEEIAAAIRKVANGQKYLSAEIAQRIAISGLEAPNDSPFNALSEREMQVMFLITRGKNVQEISDSLFLSDKTVHGYRYRIFEKLGVKNDVELTVLAMKYRIINTPEEVIS